MHSRILFTIVICNLLPAESQQKYYAFSSYPVEANLVNGEGLPAACFEEQIDLNIKI